MSTSVAQLQERLEAVVPAFTGTATRKQVKLKELKTDPAYQRDLTPRHVERIQNNWDETAAEAIIVSKREDGMYIVNGQHRVAAAIKLGHTYISGIVIEGMTIEEEAALRVKMNMRINDSPLDRFRAQLLAGDPVALRIEAILKGYDTFVNKVPNGYEGVNAVTTLETLYKIDDGYTLDSVLAFITTVFGEVHGRHATAPLFRAVAWFLDKHATDAEPERMGQLIKGFGMAALDRRARSLWGVHGGTLWLNYYRAFVEIYNEGLSDKKKLEWKTRGYGSRSDSGESPRGGGGQGGSSSI